MRWRDWRAYGGANGQSVLAEMAVFCSGASNGARIARGRVALMARGDERSLLSRIAPPGVVAADGGCSYSFVN